MLRQLASLFCLLSFTHPLAEAADSFTIYAPSRKSEAILTAKAEINGGNLALTQTETIDLGFAATTIVKHPKLPILYVSINRGDENKCPGATIHIGDSGVRITPFILKHGYSYLSLDRKNRFLLGANYSDGFVDIYSLDSEGSIEKHVTGLNEGRKAAHCILPSPDNKFVYIPYVKDNNALYQYAFDNQTGALSALEPRNANPPEGTGPRHMAYHPSESIIYFSNEQGLGVSVYQKDETGQLKLIQVIEAIGDKRSKDGLSSSDILITPDGKFVFAGIRGHKQDFDRISRYKVLPDGKLELLGLTKADPIPWGLTLSPDGKYLIATSFKGGTLMAFKIKTDGKLIAQNFLKWDENISDVVCK